jgi:GntR family transcriptional regulator
VRLYRSPVTIDPWAPLPPYKQLAAILRARIEAGELVPGAVVPSEATLVQEYGLARETVRRTVKLLREEGYVFTVAGRGTYVAERDGE